MSVLFFVSLLYWHVRRIKWANSAETLAIIGLRRFMLFDMFAFGFVHGNIEIEWWYNIILYDLDTHTHSHHLALSSPPRNSFLLQLVPFAPVCALSCFILLFAQICLSIYPLNLESVAFCVFFSLFFVRLNVNVKIVLIFAIANFRYRSFDYVCVCL